jgi:membrane protein implicated in regulation of membrane protease activity
MEFAIRTKTIVRAMSIAVLLLTLAGLAARFALFVFGDGPFMRPLSLFDVSAERNIPTWFESMQFMLCSVLLAVVAVAAKQRGGRNSKH